MITLGIGGTSAFEAHLLQTVACRTGSRKEFMIALALVTACVINGDTVTGVLRQATWLVVAIIVLIVVKEVAGHLPRPFVNPASGPDISG